MTTSVEPKKRDRLHVRLPSSDTALIKAGAQRLDCTVSEMVRRAAVDAALQALGRKA
jgi:uncharacterized protein (DUF1778 family)